MIYSFKDIKAHKPSLKKVFFFRICGTGMGAAAFLLKRCGYHVEGADSKFYPPMSEYLKTVDIPLKNIDELDKEYLESFDLIVVGNVIAKNSKDAAFLESLSTPLASFPATIGGLVFSEKKMVGIAGTHGKTTTTYFFTQVFSHLGKKPGHLIGGVLPDRAIAEPGEDYFFIEADEYDSSYFEKFSKFRSYDLNHMIITSLEFDHADIFANMEQIEEEFTEAFKTIDGSLIYNSSYESAEKIVSRQDHISDKISYGPSSDTGPFDISVAGGRSSFYLSFNGQSYQFDTNIVGIHNILNLSSVILFAFQEGFSAEQIQNSIKELKLVKRRQEVRGYYKETLIIDDFAHHPTAVSSTLESLNQAYKDKKIKIILEPNSATARSDIFQEEFAHSFKYCKELVIAKPSNKTSVKSANDLDCDLLASEVQKNYGIKAKVVTSLEDLRSSMDEMVGHDSLIATFSNGTCLGLWNSDFVAELSNV